MLQTRDITKSFGGLRAVNAASIEVPGAAITAVIGPNGAGKTTLMNIISGFAVPDSGSVTLDGKAATGARPHQLCAMGLARTFQNLQMFSDMSVLEVVTTGRYRHQRASLLSNLLHLPSTRAEERAAVDNARDILRFLGVEESYWERRAGDLPYGVQRRTEIARALATEPKYLLLDEPAAGLNNQETADLGRVLRLIADSGVAVVLIEHDIDLVMDVSQRIFVLDAGTVIADGDPAAIRSNEAVIAAYFGGEE